MPRVLLDTSVLIWAIETPHRLPSEIREIVEDTANEVIFSAASIWEIAIKSALRKPNFKFNPRNIAADAVAIGLVERPITAGVAAQVTDLPMLHHDPFDRLIMAQAMSEPARMLTSDRMLKRYSDLVIVFQPR